jgi:hypothetical protein
LKDSSEERQLAKRYAGEMNADEDELQNLRKEYIGLQQQLAAAQAALHDAIQQMNVDLDVSGV